MAFTRFSEQGKHRGVSTFDNLCGLVNALPQPVDICLLCRKEVHVEDGPAQRTCFVSLFHYASMAIRLTEVLKQYAGQRSTR